MNTINVTKRDLTVKAKKLRRNGYVPGSVFGGMLKEPVALQIEESVARQLVRELREGSRLKLNLDGTVIPVQIKEKSLDNLKHEILEISFQALAADQAVNSDEIVFRITDGKRGGGAASEAEEAPAAE